MNYKFYQILLGFFYFFNLFDAIATFYFVAIKKLQKLNPIMKFFLDVNPWLFLAVKIFSGSIVVGLFISNLDSKLARIGTILIFTVYLFIFLYYVAGIIYIS